jgi:Secretion system C-terminal sorting domain
MNCKFLLSATFIAASFLAGAQNATKTYAITGRENNQYFWADIKQVDLAAGKVIKTLFEADKSPFKKEESASDKETENKAYVNPTAFGAAACAFDAVHNRLYFAPLHFSDIQYLDLNKPVASFITIKSKVIALPAGNTGYQPEENQLTRMVIAADGYGYALTNDANHLIRFSTGKKTLVEDLGSLNDASGNKEISIHKKASGWGGDMVADAFGKLVLVSAGHEVFIIDVNTKSAVSKGAITGLPVNFTTNGAAVNDDGDLVVSSANIFETLYKVNMKDLSAEKINSTEKPFNASDLANGNFLLQKEADIARNTPLSKPWLTANTSAKIFPNPSAGSEFRVLFKGQASGKYTIVLTDLSGKAIQSKVVTISKNGQAASFSISQYQTKGTYLVNVFKENKQIAFSEKLVIN